LPDGWAWFRLSFVATFAGGKTPSTDNPDFWNGSVNWVTSKDMKSKYIYDTQTKMSELGAEQMQLYYPNTLLMVVRSGILRRTLPLAILKTISTVNQDLKTISFCFSEICEYCYYYYTAIEKEILTKYQKDGKTVESINFEDFKDINIPLPPLAEQHRIVTAIESAFALIDEIERNKTDLQAAVAAAKSKILSLAIRGKLIPQDPNDEPVSALLERIRAEREALIKAGKIKRGKSENTAVRICDNSYYENVPFVIPKSWLWYKLSDLWGLLSGRDLTPSEYSDSEVGIPYITGASNFTNNGLIINRWTTCPKVIAQNGDLLITCKGTVGTMMVNNQGEVHIARQIMAVRNYFGLDVEFLRIFMTSFIMQIVSAAKGIIPGISREDLLEMFIPCPPLYEQTRIVKAVSKVDVMLNQITASFN